MTTENTNGKDKKEITDHPAVSNLVQERGNDGIHIAKIGAKRGASERYEIAFPMPKPGDVADYDSVVKFLETYYKNEDQNPDGSEVTPQDLVGYAISAAVMNMSVRPDFKSVGFDDNGQLVENGHTLMQELADNVGLVPSKRKGGASGEVKAKAQTADRMGAVLATINSSELSSSKKAALCMAVTNKLFAGTELTEKDASALADLGITI